ncbi:DUF2325 domain-containing protein [Melghiribacillus thermohalophilus]|uniref:DUF2325 domain-containing protein n=1 Tax=Melghiribacillus thermohalophilus TaxID=1324956 RepID=UPI001043715C
MFKEQLEARGGAFLFTDGTERKDRLAALIQKSDVVVILTSFIRHLASYNAIDLCKEHKKPFSVVSELGIKSLVQGALSPTHIK